MFVCNSVSVCDIISHFLQILQYQVQQSYQNKVLPSSAVLFVYVERAHGLPVRSSGVIYHVAFMLSLVALTCVLHVHVYSCVFLKPLLVWIAIFALFYSFVWDFS